MQQPKKPKIDYQAMIEEQLEKIKLDVRGDVEKAKQELFEEIAGLRESTNKNIAGQRTFLEHSYIDSHLEM